MDSGLICCPFVRHYTKDMASWKVYFFPSPSTAAPSMAASITIKPSMIAFSATAPFT